MVSLPSEIITNVGFNGVILGLSVDGRREDVKSWEIL